MDRVEEGWRLVSFGAEGHATNVGGTNPWDVEWISSKRQITVAHPQYPNQTQRIDVYELAGADPPVVFAAGEFSNGVWGIFVPV